jgi:L-asparaginase/Glu-tRNA(Gln) amidotransferase subunit D
MSREFAILIVDEGLAGRKQAVRSSLSRSHPDWRLCFARSKDEALAHVSTASPDAVVLGADVPPGGAALEVLSFLRKQLPATPAVVLCGASDGRVIRDFTLPPAESEGLSARDFEPDGFLFKEELVGDGDWGPLAAAISAGLFKYGRVRNESGVLITHGTDTMAWGLAYLRYALKDLTANVAVTGSQVPLEGYFSSSDALGNLKTAVTLLDRLRPAHLFAVFNSGRKVFSGRLTKFRKWDADAFDGRAAASAGPEGLKALRGDWVFIPYPDQRLSDLHIIRTGGTIESQKEGRGGGPLKPTGDFVWKYVSESLSHLFSNAHRHDLLALDSSNVSFEEWARVAQAVRETGVAGVDTRFDLTVRPVFANPLFTTKDYRAQFAACGRGAVFAGYGGGNANVLEGSERSVLPALRESIREGTFVAVTSQVPLEPYDAEYETGLRLIEAGGMPCGDLPLADAQVKLSYLLGHWDELEAAAAAADLEPRLLLTASFLSGVSMRKASSMERFMGLAEARGAALRILPEDPFVLKPFSAGLAPVIQALKP